MYWYERNIRAQQKLSDKQIKDIEKQMRVYYGRASQKILDEFEKTYNKILLTIQEDKTPTPADLYKLDKYWQMQAQIKKELQKLGDRQINALSKAFEVLFYEAYTTLELPVVKEQTFTSIDKSMIAQLINTIWVADGKSWSDRVWENTDKLQQALNDNLLHCVITGKKTSELKKLLQAQFNVSYSRADALVRTEMAHIQTQAAQQRYEDYGIKEVEVWADEDERRCEKCGKLHEKRFKITDKMPVPVHTNCRCSIIPVIE